MKFRANHAVITEGPNLVRGTPLISKHEFSKVPGCSGGSPREPWQAAGSDVTVVNAMRAFSWERTICDPK